MGPASARPPARRALWDSCDLWGDIGPILWNRPEKVALEDEDDDENEYDPTCKPATAYRASATGLPEPRSITAAMPLRLAIKGPMFQIMNPPSALGLMVRSKLS
jgi:hypothetical protein